MDSIADSGIGGDAPTPITGASTDREDEDAGMGLLADGRRRREPQTITRPVPVLIRPAQAATSGTLTRPWVAGGVRGDAGAPALRVAGTGLGDAIGPAEATGLILCGGPALGPVGVKGGLGR